MAKVTLLDIVQEILSDADGDNVNSISDTVESDQCARVVRSIFYDIVDQYDLVNYKGTKRLDATGASTPCEMTRPEGFVNIEWIKYDKKTSASADADYQYVKYLPPEDFLKIVHARAASDSNVTTQALDSGHSINIINDTAPTYWTILEGYDNIVFDSYDSALETNLQQSKSLAYGDIRPTLALTDAAIPDLPENLAQLLKNRARAFWFDVQKDGVSREIDKRSRNSEVRAQRLRFIAGRNRGNNTGPNFGRK